MNVGKIMIVMLLVVSGGIMLWYYFHTEKPAASAFKAMVSGAAALLAVHYFGYYAGVEMPVNLFTTLTALVLGIPGVIAAAITIKFFL